MYLPHREGFLIEADVLEQGDFSKRQQVGKEGLKSREGCGQHKDTHQLATKS